MEINWPDDIHARRFLACLGEMVKELDALRLPTVSAVLDRFECRVLDVPTSTGGMVNLTFPEDIEATLPPELKVG